MEREEQHLWRWNTDAKLLRAGSHYQAVNFATRSTFEFHGLDAKSVASISGLTIPFQIPGTLSREAEQALRQGRFVIPADDIAYYEADVRKRLATSLRASHGFIIMPTERCNFRCTYCYESFIRGRMSAANADAMSAAIARVATKAPMFGLSFFGGEPLLCSDLVERFSREAFHVLQRRGMSYAASIATNGFLLSRPLFERLLDVGVVSYQITVDGAPQTHDQQRPTVRGAGTFDRIASNLRGMHETSDDFCCVVRCNVHEHQFAEILEFFAGPHLAFLRDDPRFIVDVHRIWASDQVDAPQQAATCASPLTSQLDYYLLNSELERLGIATVPYGQLPGTLGSGCYAGKPNWFVVGPDLSLYKCTVVFNREENKLGSIAPDGELVVNEARNRLWTGSNALTDAGCASCHYRVPCGGIACPLTRFTNGAKSCPELKHPAALMRWAGSKPSSRRQQKEEELPPAWEATVP
jgi:uncharacterized protein